MQPKIVSPSEWVGASKEMRMKLKITALLAVLLFAFTAVA